MCTHASQIAGDFPRARRAGLTLAELIITLVIIATVASMVLPSFNTDEARLRSAGRWLVADLEFAQVESIAHPDDPRVVVVSLIDSRYHIAPRSSPLSPIINPITHKPYETRFGSAEASGLSGVTISAIDLGGDNKLEYGRYGQLDQATPATITLAAGGSTLTITIDHTNGSVSAGQIQ